MPLKLVISYATTNLPWVQKVKAALASEDVSVFVAEYDVAGGQDLKQAISRAIKDCDVLVLLWSKEANQSKWVPEEVARADALGKEVIPLVLDDDRDLPQFISGHKYLNLGQDPDKVMAELKLLIDGKADKKAGRQLVGLLLTVVGLFVMAR